MTLTTTVMATTKANRKLKEHLSIDRDFPSVGVYFFCLRYGRRIRPRTLLSIAHRVLSELLRLITSVALVRVDGGRAIAERCNTVPRWQIFAVFTRRSEYAI